ncbi:hypothetical protein EC9_27610 [Rosistilla ulvae]|uniref:Uncharacterized protein n=1 Tax=Rosistilla ulvae TaxID=1930277 RepID=A0A517M114_9BACT|nr:hypothetical protein EC9_27610 [Rosistilla ulvae]
MTDQSHIKKLLEEILESNRDPVVVCAGRPDLLPELHRRLQEVRRTERQVERLFPEWNRRPMNRNNFPTAFARVGEVDRFGATAEGS